MAPRGATPEFNPYNGEWEFASEVMLEDCD